MVSAPRISVVLPVYNESDNIAPCLRGLWAALRGVEHELLVCYDFDEDTTLPAIRAMGDAPPTVRLVKNELGRGAANALRAGFAAATGDVVVTSMADLSDPPEAILAMAEKVRAGAAVVSGSRYMRGGSQSGGPLIKRTLSRAACLLLRWIAGLGTHDATTNFKGYAKSFLARTTVESTTAFDIALELTVKAHLSGERVDEVPSSWIDRAHGASRFRVWAWAPHYLRWWGRAMLEPACVWLAWLALTLWSFVAASRGEGQVLVLALSAVGMLAILAARASRGRMRIVDAVHVLLWCHPWHVGLWRGGRGALDVAATLAASVAALLATVGATRLRAFAGRTAACVRSLATPRNLAALAFGVVLWLVRFAPPKITATPSLDQSWREALSYFHAHGLQAGVDWIFTYGPLGFLDVGQYRSEEFWTRLWVWEFAFELACAAVFAVRFAQLDSWLLRVLFAVASCLAASSSDAYMPLVVVLVAIEWLYAEHSSVSAFCACAALLAVIALVKFSFFVLAAVCVAIVLAAFVRRRQYVGAATATLLLIVALAITWVVADQRLGNAPRFVSMALAMTGGYTDGMSLQAPASALAIGAVTLALVLVCAALHAFAGKSTLERRASAAIVGVGALMAYKSSFVRFDRDGMFALYAVVAVCALGDEALRGTRVMRWIVWVPRLACLSIALLGTRAGNDRRWRGVGELVPNAAASCASGARFLTSLRATKDALDKRAQTQREFFDLPRIHEVVGSTPCDLLGVNQALLFRAGLEYRPRPVFQPYAAYTPELASLNARFLESSAAPKFMLVRLEGIDGHLPALDDPLAMQVVLRDYEPQLVERGCMLWTRRADAPRTSARSRPLVLERTGTLGEWLELGELSGAAHVATIEIEPSWLGRAKRAAYQADALVLQVRSANGDIQVSRAPPTSLRTSFILDPMLNDHFAFVRWVSGVPVGRARAVRLIEYADAGGAFAKSFKLRIERAEELAPEPPPDAEKRFVYAMFDVKPDFVRSTSEATSTIMGDREALVVYAPSEMSFSVAPGRYVLRGMFGLGPNVLAGAVSDGVTFSAVLDGESKPIFQRHIDPVHVPAERGLFPFKYEFTAQRATQLVLRTHPGSRNDRTDDSACWSGLKIEPLGR